jgi:hypothetical protein
MEQLFWICVAGAAGTGARYLIALWAAQQAQVSPLMPRS